MLLDTSSTPRDELPQTPRDGIRPLDPLRLITPLPIPIPPTSIVGRHDEIRTVVELLTDQQARLVALVGSGGVGKSRLAIAVAQTIAANHVAPVAYLPLASLWDPSRLLATIAAGCGISEMPPDPTVDQFVTTLGARRLLLVLDNLEQLIDTAPLLAELLRSCRGLQLLSASRRHLHLSGEQVVVVEELPCSTIHVESLDSIEPGSALQLFVERASAARPSADWPAAQLRASAEICRLVEGEPLAIELAAARVSVLPPTALLPRMGRVLAALGSGPSDADPRLRTMRQTIRWSYELLTPPAQQVFRTLGVFVGGCTLDEAEAVVSAPPEEVLDLLGELIEHSLLRSTIDDDGAVRFTMSPPIWEFAAELLAASPEATNIHDAHARTFTQWLQSADVFRNDSARVGILRRYLAAWANIRAAMEWLIDSGQGYRALELAWATSDFGGLRLNAAEVRAWMERAYDLTAEDPSTPLRVRITSWIGLMSSIHAEDDRALQFARLAIEQAESIGDVLLTSFVLRHAGQVARGAGAIEEALQHHSAALALEESQPTRQRLASHYEYGATLIAAGRYGEAEEHIQSAAALAEQVQVNYLQPLCELGLARLELQNGRPALAGQRLTRLLDDILDRRDLGLVAEALLRVAAFALAIGRVREAATILSAGERLLALTSRRRFRDRPLFEDVSQALTARLGQEELLRARSEGAAMTEDEAITHARSVLHAVNDGPARPSLAGPLVGLSPREREVLALLTAGKTDREIADALFISRSTVSRHVESILRKLQVSSRTAAAVVATRAANESLPE